MTGSGGGPELFRLVRFWSRRWASRVADQATERVHVQHVLLVEAISTKGGDATVAEVAHQLGVDRSVASRMITEAVSAGYADRRTSPDDARRIGLRLTREGKRLLAASHRWQQETFDNLVAHWSVADRRRLAGYLRRLATEVIDDSTHAGK